MKNILITLATVCLLLMTQSVFGQNYGKFSIDLGARYNLVTGDNFGNGVGFLVEPQITVKDNINLGLRFGFDLLGSANSSIGGGISVLSSYFLFGDYYFSKTSNTRAFAGLGFGAANQGGVFIDEEGIEIGLGTVFGLSPRVGFDLDFIKIYVDYNLYFKKRASNYIGLNFALNFGGRYKG